MATTRGDRLFVGLLAAAYVNLAWTGLTDLGQWMGGRAGAGRGDTGDALGMTATEESVTDEQDSCWRWPPWQPRCRSRRRADADVAAAEKWLAEELKPSTLSRQQQLDELKWFIAAAAQAARQGRHPGERRLRDHQDPRIRVQDAGPGVRGDHRHQGQTRPHPGRRRGREAADVHAVGPVHLRRLDLRLGPDRHALPLRGHPAAVRLHGRRGQGVHQPDPGPERLHRRSSSPPRPTRSCTSCPTSSSPTCTGSGPTGSRARTCRSASGRSTATSWASRSTGRPTRTSPTSSPTR